MKKIIVGILIGFSLSASSAAAAATYTAAQVATHNTSADCWTIVSNKVYNLTSYIPYHPGGPAAIIGLCGHDGTAAFSGMHSGSTDANSMLASLYIGDLLVPDTTAPSVPAGLSATAISASQINLSWTASADDTGVSGYKVYRNGAQIATSTAPAYNNNTGLTASTTYSYQVLAFDAAGNVSGLSNLAGAATLPAPVIPPVPLPGPITTTTPPWSHYRHGQGKHKKHDDHEDDEGHHSAGRRGKGYGHISATEKITQKYNKKLLLLNSQLQRRLAGVNRVKPVKAENDD